MFFKRELDKIIYLTKIIFMCINFNRLDFLCYIIFLRFSLFILNSPKIRPTLVKTLPKHLVKLWSAELPLTLTCTHCFTGHTLMEIQL